MTHITVLRTSWPERVTGPKGKRNRGVVFPHTQKRVNPTLDVAVDKGTTTVHSAAIDPGNVLWEVS